MIRAALTLLLSIVWCDTVMCQEGINLQRIPSKTEDFGSAAVVVEEGCLLHTVQIFPIDESGKTVSEGLPLQLQRILVSLNSILQSAGIDESSVIRLQINLSDSSHRDLILASLKHHWGEKPSPALSFVQGKLPIAGVQVAIDAIAAVPAKPERNSVELITSASIPGHTGTVASILPDRRVMHIAGQAEKGSNVRECTRMTLNHLRQTLEWQTSGWKDVASIKCFLTPMESASEVIEEVDTVCGKNHPPIIFVEWRSDLPIEIELVASASGSLPMTVGPGERLGYLTPPDMTASPVYSRLVISGGTPIYVSGLLAQGASAADPETETRDLFRQLREILEDPTCKSDLQHLVKATYYCSADSTSRALNAVRPDYYDPGRPPAASKALVPGVGQPGRNITFDMIAVRKPVP